MAKYVARRANKVLQVQDEREIGFLATRGFNIWEVDGKGNEKLHKAGVGQTVSLDAHEKVKAENKKLEAEIEKLKAEAKK